jgi:hypothetical protein
VSLSVPENDPAAARPFVCSAIIHGERIFAAQDLTHAQAAKKAKRIGGKAVEGVWIPKATLDRFRAGRSSHQPAFLILLDAITPSGD